MSEPQYLGRPAQTEPEPAPVPVAPPAPALPLDPLRLRMIANAHKRIAEAYDRLADDLTQMDNLDRDPDDTAFQAEVMIAEYRRGKAEVGE